jgi:DNA-binding transcriptional ArsR family regulator
LPGKRAEIFKVLGVESRLKIIEILKLKGPMGVNDLAEILKISPSAVSQHLKILKFAGLVHNERKGFWIPYDIDPSALETCGRIIMRVCNCECCGTRQTSQSEASDKAAQVKALKEYEKDLRGELGKVQARIDELKKKR